MQAPVAYPSTWRTQSVALCHDWLTGMRGGEKVLELIGAGFPSAPLYCLLHKPASVSSVIENREIHTSFLQRVPGIYSNYRYLLPLFPVAIYTLGNASADILISTSHCAAKALRKRSGAKHLCYCFTPMRYAWTFHDEYFGRSLLKRAALAPLLGSLRRWDRSNSAGVDHFVAISRHVRDRIRRFYGREADIVYPPVDTNFYSLDESRPREDFDLVVSALVPYKRVDLAVAASTKTGRRLVVVGTGTEFEKLKASAGPSVSFLGWQPDERIRELYQTCRHLIFPGEEDFGIVPAEAMACGTPVLAFGQGGATETVINGATGLFFEKQTPEALIDVIRQAEGRSWEHHVIRRRAGDFSQQKFIDGFAASLERCLRS